MFGGQVLGQALSAALQTVPPERGVHSLHAYFLRPGDPARQILYDADRIRDGRSFTTRRVVAIQGGRPIFSLGASFQVAEDGFEHRATMPDVPGPEGLESHLARTRRIADRLPKALRSWAVAERPIETRPVDAGDPLQPARRPAGQAVWYRADGELPDDPWIHRCLLAYASDFHLLATALLPHGVSLITPGLQIASLDHAMWFHAPCRMDDWLVFVMESPFAGGSRGLVQGRFFTRDGLLVASVVQEGLTRRRSS